MGNLMKVYTIFVFGHCKYNGNIKIVFNGHHNIAPTYLAIYMILLLIS